MALWLRWEYALHMVDARLAYERGDKLLSADCEELARRCEGRLAKLRIQE